MNGVSEAEFEPLLADVSDPGAWLDGFDAVAGHVGAVGADARDREVAVEPRAQFGVRAAHAAPVHAVHGHVAVVGLVGDDGDGRARGRPGA